MEIKTALLFGRRWRLNTVSNRRRLNVCVLQPVGIPDSNKLKGWSKILLSWTTLLPSARTIRNNIIWSSTRHYAALLLTKWTQMQRWLWNDCLSSKITWSGEFTAKLDQWCDVSILSEIAVALEEGSFRKEAIKKARLRFNIINAIPDGPTKAKFLPELRKISEVSSEVTAFLNRNSANGAPICNYLLSEEQTSKNELCKADPPLLFQMFAQMISQSFWCAFLFEIAVPVEITAIITY